MSPLPAPVPSTDDLRRLVSAVGARVPACDDRERIDRVRALEELRGAVAAAQAEEMADFAASQEAANRAAGVPAERRGRGVAAQVALALRCSPWQASRRLGFATVLCRELPATHARLRAGRTSEWRAMLVARETAVLSLHGRLEVDAALAPRLETLGDRQVEAETRQAAYRLDPAAAVARAAYAERDRRVTIRPAPDAMCRLSALLPAAQGVAAYAALARAADTSTAAGDERGRGQVMADTLVERVTGQRQAADVPIEVVLVMPTDTFTDDGDEPAHLDGYGPVPAGLGRQLALGGGARWLRRLFSRPGSGELAGLETHRREFIESQRRFLRLRDRTCRTPWCDAPIRHADHVRPHEQGGPTRVENGQGLCAACNHAKQAPGWDARVGAGATIVTRTPTGHTYASRAPNITGPPRSPVELRFHRGLVAAIDAA